MDFYFDDELSGLLEWNSIEKPKIFSGPNLNQGGKMMS